ncbi:type II toxin-antitoxin system ParD family antitoxin [Acidisoma silvae]|uniref:Type II toxin-antitoxin system ParD family antitoxin n=1 Tax=Acidisoma silvae TaxID=2802396 RepID=A0A964DYT2_9PROT|nr:type II toxin-antitoxin system ParD family antitoxin [Acidisoma silvae]MCB8875354.1 type II toxin-antitoxin system ParD family antitoxin [Acidisoma silvae]
MEALRYDGGVSSEVSEVGRRSVVNPNAPKPTKLAALRAALREGEESGLTTEFDVEAFIARKRMDPRVKPEDDEIIDRSS